jgi:hypothetical protein
MFRFLTSARLSPVVEILSKPHCCLCDQLEFALKRMVTNAQLQCAVRKIDIASDPQYADLWDEYQLEIPVVRVGSVVFTPRPKIDIRAISEHVKSVIQCEGRKQD